MDNETGIGRDRSRWFVLLLRPLCCRDDPTEPLEVSIYWLFYLVILETKFQIFYIIQHGKWKWCRWESIPIILDLLADHVSAEMFSLKNNICVWPSIDRRFLKCVNQSSEAISVSRLIQISSISLFLFDLVFRSSIFRTTATLRDWKARWPCRNVYCYFFFSKMKATRDWNRKGSSCGGVLGQLLHEVLVQHCFSLPKAKWSYFKLVYNNCH